MLSNHLQDGIETAKLMWSRIPNSEDGQFEGVGLLNSSDANAVESLDYEVIENYAYREEQVCVCVGFFFFLKKRENCLLILVRRLWICRRRGESFMSVITWP